jgi:hypothetical protein
MVTLTAFLLGGTPVAVEASHQSETVKQCIMDPSNDPILCVAATRDPHPSIQNTWTGWCAATEAREPGYLECDGSPSTHYEECNWDALEEGCTTPSFAYAAYSSNYTVDAKGCMGTTIDEVIVIDLGVVTVTIDIGHTVEEGVVCVTTKSGPSGGGGTGNAIIIL